MNKICIQFVYDGEKKKMFVVWLRMCGYYTSTILFVLAHEREVETKTSQPQKRDGIVRNQQNKALHQRKRNENILLWNRDGKPLATLSLTE